MANLPYRNVKDIYDTLKTAGVVKSSLPEWSTEMNALSNSDLYSQGLDDNFVKRGSVGIDRLLEATGLPNVTANLGAGVGAVVGNEAAGRSIGHGLPRMAVNFAPLAVASLASGGLATPLALGATGLLSGAETYTNTGSKAAGVLSGATNIAMPGVANLAENATLRALGAKALSGPLADAAGNVTGNVSRFFPTVPQNAMSFLAGQGAGAVLGEASAMGQAGLDPNSDYHFSPSEAVLNMTLGQLPFAASHLAGKVVGREDAPSYQDVDALLKSSQQRIAEKAVRDEGAKRTPIESLPEVVPQETSPLVLAELSARLAKIRGEKQAVVESGAPDSARKLSDLDAQELSAMEESQGRGVLGEQLTPTADRVGVLGTEHFYNPKTGYRIIKVSDDIANIDAGFTPGDLVGFSSKFGKYPVAGQGGNVYDVPLRYHTKGIKDNKVLADAAKLAETPNLPLQSETGLDHVREFQADLADAKTRLDSLAEGDTEGFRQAIEAYNGVLQKHGYEPLNDKKIAEFGQFVGAKDMTEAAKGSINKVMLRMKQREEQEKAANELLAQWAKEPEVLDMYNATEAGRPGSFVKALKRWVADGQPGSIEGLRTRALKAKNQGGDGAEKPIKGGVVEKTVAAVKEADPSTEHLRDLRRSVAEGVTEMEFNDPDVAQWREAFADGSLFADPKLKAFANDPAVKEWTNAANTELERLGQHGPGRDLAPGANDGSAPKPFEPQTDAERAAVASVGTDGVGLAQNLAASADPVTATLAKTLLAQYQETLKRNMVHVLDMSPEGFAQSFGNREAGIFLSHGTVLSQDAVRAEQVKMHELMHGLTLSELDNPTKKVLVDELTQQRERLIEALPATVKARVKELIDSDWITSFARGAGYEKMNGGKESLKAWEPVMYGLLNNKELITQAFTTKQMQKYMAVLKAPAGKKGFGVFVDWVKRFLGFDPATSDSELARFLDTTSRILQQGEYVSDFSNFTDHWFAQKGLAPGLIREQSRKALEVVQSSSIQPSKQLMIDTLSPYESRSPEFQAAKKGLEQMLVENGEEAKAAREVFGELDTPIESIDNLLSVHLGDGVSDMSDAMALLPDAVTKYMFESARDMKEVLESVEAAVKEKNDGLINLANPKEVRGPVREALKSINNFLKFEQEDMANRQLLARMQTVAPDAFFDAVLSEPSRVPERADDKGVLSAVGDFIGRNGGRAAAHFLQQPAQIARSNPLFGEWYSKAILMPAKIREMTKASMAIFGRTLTPDGVASEAPVSQELARMYKSLESPQFKSALDKLIYLKQERGGNKVGQLDYNDPEVAKILNSLPEGARKDLIDMDNKIRLSKVAADQQTLHSMQEVFATLASRVVMRDAGMKMSPAVDAANKVFDALLQMQTNPAVANATLASVQSRMQPEAFLNLLKFTQDSVEQHQTYAKYLSENPDWVSAQRNGTFLFEFLKNGKMVKASAENMKDAKQKSGGKEILNWRKNTREDGDAVFLGDNASDIIGRLRQLEENQLDMLKNVMSPEDIASFQQTSPIAQFERETAAQQRGVEKQIGNTRKLSKGAEELPWFENHIDWIQKNASYWQKRLLRSQGESMVLEPGTAGTETAGLIKQHLDELMQRDPEIGRQIQSVASTWSIGFNVATQIANSTQTFMRGVTELISSGAGPISALREISSAWSDYAGHKLSDKPYRGADEERFIKSALHDGQIDASIFDDNAAANEAAAVNFKRVINKQRPKTIGEHLSSAAGAYSTAGMWMFKHGERANNEVTLLAAYRTLKKLRPELGEEGWKKQAYLVNAAANDVGGRANRPLGLYSGKGDFARTVAMTASSLQSYLLGSTFQLIRNIKAGAFRPAGLTPSEVFSARKAAVYQLASQFAAAGTLGMPFVSGALALLDQAFPELEVNKNLRQSVSSLLNSDGENGHILSDMALSGVPSMLGWDFQSRLSAGNLLPGVSEYNGFQPEQLLGVPASLVTRFVNGGRELASGDLQGGYSFVPPAFQKVAKLLTGDASKDYRGRPVLQATPGEKFGQALGFQPTRLTQLNTADQLARQSETLENRRAGQENQRLAGEVMKGNFGTVRAALQSRIQSDKEYNPVDAVRAIARSVEEMTFVKDLRREGSSRDADTRSKLLGSFQIDPSSASEVKRLQFRQGIQQRLGLTVTSSRELELAQMMDQLRQRDPNATRAALRVSAEQLLRRTAPSRTALQLGPDVAG